METYEPNPAVTSLTNIPPAMLEDLIENPQAMNPTYRIMLASAVDATYRRIQDPSTPVGQRIQFIDQLAKLADAYPKAGIQANANAGGPALSVQIIFNKPEKAAPVIEATTVEVKEVVEQITAVAND
jgi:hypothetical protein